LGEKKGIGDLKKTAGGKVVDVSFGTGESGI